MAGSIMGECVVHRIDIAKQDITHRMEIQFRSMSGAKIITLRLSLEDFAKAIAGLPGQAYAEWFERDDPPTDAYLKEIEGDRRYHESVDEPRGDDE